MSRRRLKHLRLVSLRRGFHRRTPIENRKKRSPNFY
nr:MAG TPA: hypothetical protein [Caudoviricetes sp.]